MKRALPDYFGWLNPIQTIENFIRSLLAGDLDGHVIRLPRFELDGMREAEGYDGEFWNMGMVMDLLKSYHIAVIAYGYTANDTWIRVPKRQARFAEYVLLRAGAPVKMATVDERNPAWANDPRHEGKLPPRWDDRAEWFKEREARG